MAKSRLTSRQIRKRAAIAEDNEIGRIFLKERLGKRRVGQSPRKKVLSGVIVDPMVLDAGGALCSNERRLSAGLRGGNMIPVGCECERETWMVVTEATRFSL